MAKKKKSKKKSKKTKSRSKTIAKKKNRPAKRTSRRAARKKVVAVPTMYGSITPYLVLDGCAGAIDFYRKALGATEQMRMSMPDGKVGHAELRFGNRVVMMADATPQFPPTSTMLVLYVEDCDAVFARAIAAGAQAVQPLEDKFYGDRSGTIRDPAGQHWTISTHKEDLTPAEIEERAKHATAAVAAS